MNLPALVRFSQQDVYMSLTILGCTVNCRFRFADCPLIHCEQVEWKHKWQMQFNADKCEVLRITNKRNPTICNYRVHDQHLQTVKQAKYLGATISSDLSWNQHVDNTVSVKKATNTLNFLRRNIRDCPPRVKEQCYKSLVRPIMEYAS